MKEALTPRELQTLDLIVRGMSDRQIAAELGITIHTVNAYRKRLLKKLEVNNVASMVRVALQDQYIKL